MIHLITGELVQHEEDFSLPGPIPLNWKRNFFSFLERDTPIGVKWHFNYDQWVNVDKADATFEWQNDNGNIIGLPYLTIGDEAVIAEEKITYRHDEGRITIHNYEEDITYIFDQCRTCALRSKYVLTFIKKHRFQLSFKYDELGRMERVIDSSGRTLVLKKDELKRITAIELLGDGAEPKTMVSYEYNSDEMLQAVYDALDQPTKYTYDNKQLVIRNDANGQSQCYQYEDRKHEPRCVARWQRKKQAKERFTFLGDRTVVTDERGFETTYYFEDEKVSKIVDALGNTEQWEYNMDGFLMRHTDKMGMNTYYGYDDYGNQTSIRRANGGITNFHYENNKLTMAKNPNDALWLWQYDDDGFLKTRIGPDNDVTHYHYENDLLTKITDAAGEETHLHYNDNDVIEKVVLPNGSETQWRYDSQGQLLNAVSNRQVSMDYWYDDLGRVTEMKTTDGNRVFLEYDGVGNVVKAKDDHHEVEFKYNPSGQLVKRKEGHTEIEFAYNKADQLIAITNEHNNMYRFQRNPVGDIVEESGFDGLTRHYERDAGGSVAVVKTPDGRDTQYIYDNIGNVSRIVYNDATQEAFSYDKAGLLISATNAEGRVEMERDAVGRIIKETQNHVEINNTFNRTGERIHIASSLGADIAIDRNKLGEVVKTDASQGDSQWQATFKHNLYGQEVERQLPGGVTSTWERDATGRPRIHLVSAHDKVQRNRRYHWDVNDRLRGITDELSSSLVRFEHDMFGNLASAQYPDGIFDFKLPDETGNLYRSKDRNDRSYGKAGQLLKDENYTYSYDRLGNLIKKQSATEKWEYRWNQSGMLEEVKRPDRTIVRFTYDALGRRITKTADGHTTHFVWDGNVPLHEWTTPEGAALTSVDEKGEIHMDAPENLITWLFEEDSFVPMAKLQDGKSYSIVTDHLGTPCEAYDEEGKKVWECELDIYGKVRNIVGQRSLIPFRY
ncbi:MAG: DUF6531 domain-containing protein, partial [Bacteroidales bacterium]|nr:DUF6531 domain-containing protein [Bacteroidales bacterium]